MMLTCHVAIILGKLITWLTKEASNQLLKGVIRCYVCLADNPIGIEALRHCLPVQLIDNTFEMHFHADKSIEYWHTLLLKALKTNDFNTSKRVK